MRTPAPEPDDDSERNTIPLTRALTILGARALILAADIAAWVEPRERKARAFLFRLHDAAMVLAVGLDGETGDET